MRILSVVGDCDGVIATCAQCDKALHDAGVAPSASTRALLDAPLNSCWAKVLGARLGYGCAGLNDCWRIACQKVGALSIVEMMTVLPYVVSSSVTVSR